MNNLEEIILEVVKTPSTSQRLVNTVLSKLVLLELWHIKAIEAGWYSPNDWYSAEREKIKVTINHLFHDTKQIDLDANWLLVRTKPVQNV